MKYGGSFRSGWSNAIGTNNKVLQKDVLLDEIARIIDSDKDKIIHALRASNVRISKEANQRAVIDHVSTQIYTNPAFQQKISELIALKNPDIQLPGKNKGYANSGGQMFADRGFGENSVFRGLMDKLQSGGGGGSGAPGGSAAGAGAGAGKVGAITAMIGTSVTSVFGFLQSKQELKSEQQRTRTALYDKLLNKKTNYMPILIVGGVLIIGGFVAYLSLKPAKA